VEWSPAEGTSNKRLRDQRFYDPTAKARPSSSRPRRRTKAPDYRILAGSIEFGAAWKKTARDSDREYLPVKLDDPSFPAPIYASLVKGEGDDSFTLIWSRRTAE
jgi:uncharacterized protein (DUF736 family)